MLCVTWVLRPPASSRDSLFSGAKVMEEFTWGVIVVFRVIDIWMSGARSKTYKLSPFSYDSDTVAE